jgi:hypothetical protein
MRLGSVVDDESSERDMSTPLQKQQQQQLVDDVMNV